MTTTYTIDHVTSQDGTKIGYRQMGSGPGLILVHGGMQASQNFMTLGKLLSDEFTVYIPDRRGRGLSGAYADNYSLSKDWEDIAAIVQKTGARNVFGLSSGAIITLQLASKSPEINKIAIYEPPLPFKNIEPDAWSERFEKELGAGKIAEAMVTVIKGTGDTWSLSSLPRFFLIPLLKLGIRADAGEKKDGDVPIKDLIPTMHYDILLIKEIRGKLEFLEKINAKVLLLSGTRSKSFLRTATEKLHNILPGSHYVQLSGLGHTAADNGDKPERVANELKKFFLEEQKH